MDQSNYDDLIARILAHCRKVARDMGPPLSMQALGQFFRGWVALIFLSQIPWKNGLNAGWLAKICNFYSRYS